MLDFGHSSSKEKLFCCCRKDGTHFAGTDLARYSTNILILRAPVHGGSFSLHGSGIATILQLRYVYFKFYVPWRLMKACKQLIAVARKGHQMLDAHG